MPEPSVPPPLRVRNPSGTFSQIPVFELEISGGTLSRISPIRARVLIDSGAGGTGAPTGAPYVVYSANATLTASKILTAGSSVTLVTDATAVYVNALTGGGGTTVYAATGNQYVTLADAVDLTTDRVLTAGTNMVLATNATTVWVSVSAKTIWMPLALLTVQPDSANAFWYAKTGAQVDMAHVAFVDNGEGLATWWGIVPYNLAPSPIWNLQIYSVNGTATAVGTAMATFKAKSVAHGEDLDAAALTVVSSAQTFSLFRSDTLNVQAVSGGNFDSVLALSANDYLLVEVNRHGGNAADTLSDQWRVTGLALQANVL